MKYLMLLFLFFTSACAEQYQEAFSPTYGQSGCVPYQATYFEKLLEKPTNEESTSQCCEGNGIVACCFGGIHMCADGSEGTGCGCPSR